MARKPDSLDGGTRGKSLPSARHKSHCFSAPSLGSSAKNSPGRNAFLQCRSEKDRHAKSHPSRSPRLRHQPGRSSNSLPSRDPRRRQIRRLSLGNRPQGASACSGTATVETARLMLRNESPGEGRPKFSQRLVGAFAPVFAGTPGSPVFWNQRLRRLLPARSFGLKDLLVKSLRTNDLVRDPSPSASLRVRISALGLPLGSRPTHRVFGDERHRCLLCLLREIQQHAETRPHKL